MSQSHAKPRKLTVEFARESRRIAVLYRNRSRRGQGCFMLLWLIGWTVGCVFLAGLVISKPEVSTFLFAVPFWASWVFVFCMLVRSFFERELILLDEYGFSFERYVWIRIKKRVVPIEELLRFQHFSRVIDSEDNSREYGIELTTTGSPLSFCIGLPLKERLWLLPQFNDVLAEIKQLDVSELESQPVSSLKNEQQYEANEIRNAVTLPSDSRWSMLVNDPFTFEQTGKLDIAALLGLLFVCLFWNGIVSVFIWGLFSGEVEADMGAMGWWGMFVFLIPFEVIGLAMLAGFLLTLFDPFRLTSWRFGPNVITHRIAYFGIGVSWKYPAPTECSLEIHADDEEASVTKTSLRKQWKPMSYSRQTEFNLMLIDRSDTEITSIEGLTIGEAEWMKYQLETHLPECFN